MNCHNLHKQLEKKEFINIKNLFSRNFIISILWFIFWMIIYAISILIQPELIFIPMVLNLPLATFFCTGIILETLVIFIFNIDYSQFSDILGKIIVLLFTFTLNYLYRKVIFREQKSIKPKLKSRLKEFFIWILPWLLTIYILSLIYG
ncbi:hypothetical protein [Geminocystis sp. GBBB08]|uniref:hypothetical protein n=1 Tax=Geminocystis sp. GBBB08 TaxID=2604140 RepID=UPI0027E2C009|nr:hypothetical protein [Geminocystis sp. GBBB08]MBL1211008.1 hypothetical protein [Geminocystis sp. GBBB08]